MTIYRSNGEKLECGNYRGISLLDVSGKILSKVLNNRSNTYLAEKILPQSQRGFREGRGTTYMIFVCRQILEKGREQHEPNSIGFVDLLCWSVLDAPNFSGTHQGSTLRKQCDS